MSPSLTAGCFSLRRHEVVESGRLLLHTVKILKINNLKDVEKSQQ